MIVCAYCIHISYLNNREERLSVLVICRCILGVVHHFVDNHDQVYKPDEPNVKIQIDFRSSVGIYLMLELSLQLIYLPRIDADKFRECLLFLTETPDRIKQLRTLKTPTSDFETRIYSLRDEDEPLSPYHAVVSVKKPSRYPQVADIYFGELSWSIDFQSC